MSVIGKHQVDSKFLETFGSIFVVLREPSKRWPFTEVEFTMASPPIPKSKEINIFNGPKCWAVYSGTIGSGPRDDVFIDDCDVVPRHGTVKHRFGVLEYTDSGLSKCGSYLYLQEKSLRSEFELVEGGMFSVDEDSFIVKRITRKERNQVDEQSCERERDPGRKSVRFANKVRVREMSFTYSQILKHWTTGEDGIRAMSRFSDEDDDDDDEIVSTRRLFDCEPEGKTSLGREGLSPLENSLDVAFEVELERLSENGGTFTVSLSRSNRITFGYEKSKSNAIELISKNRLFHRDNRGRENLVTLPRAFLDTWDNKVFLCAGPTLSRRVKPLRIGVFVKAPVLRPVELGPGDVMVLGETFLHIAKVATRGVRVKTYAMRVNYSRESLLREPNGYPQHGLDIGLTSQRRSKVMRFNSNPEDTEEFRRESSLYLALKRRETVIGRSSGSVFANIRPVCWNFPKDVVTLICDNDMAEFEAAMGGSQVSLLIGKRGRPGPPQPLFVGTSFCIGNCRFLVEDIIIKEDPSSDVATCASCGRLIKGFCMCGDIVAKKFSFVGDSFRKTMESLQLEMASNVKPQQVRPPALVQNRPSEISDPILKGNFGRTVRVSAEMKVENEDVGDSDAKTKSSSHGAKAKARLGLVDNNESMETFEEAFVIDRGLTSKKVKRSRIHPANFQESEVEEEVPITPFCIDRQKAAIDRLRHTKFCLKVDAHVENGIDATAVSRISPRNGGGKVNLEKQNCDSIIVLQCIGGPCRHRRIVTHRRWLTIGSRDDNLVIINDRKVSGHHAVIAFINGGYHLIDRHSEHGTFIVAGKEENFQAIGPGSIISIADLEFQMFFRLDRTSCVTCPLS